MGRRLWGKFVLALACSAIAMPASASTVVSGPAEVVDGDSLSVSGLSVRLFGIDALEGRQTCVRRDQTWACGEQAATQLRALIGGSTVRCEGFGNDDYGRMLAICHAGSIELNRAMVATGWAMAFRKYSTLYVGEEEQAKGSRLGIWDSTFVSPDEYRSASQAKVPERFTAPRAVRVPPAPNFTGCVIKGNRNRKGQWIYHLPGMPYYDVTRPEEIFCTEAEARAAGYRRAIVRQ